MATTYAEKELDLDEDGFLKDIDSWDVNVSEKLARIEGINNMTAEHWKLITAIRYHYERTGVSPRCREIMRESGFTKDDMYRLFPSGHVRGAYKLAGLPKPAGCN